MAADVTGLQRGFACFLSSHHPDRIRTLYLRAQRRESCQSRLFSDTFQRVSCNLKVQPATLPADHRAHAGSPMYSGVGGYGDGQMCMQDVQPPVAANPSGHQLHGRRS